MANETQPAFPCPYQNEDGTVFHDVYTGLTKREYIATKAMQAAIIKAGNERIDLKETAEFAIEFADELLKQLEP